MDNQALVELFNQWIHTLPDDTRTLQAAADADGVPRETKLILVGGLSYLLRKIDIVPDYLSGVGVVDDAMVLRITSALAVESGLGDLGDEADAINELADAVGPVNDYLGGLYAGLVEYVKGLPKEQVRGRNAEKIVDHADAYTQFSRELKDELDGYAAKPITDGDRALRDIKSFIKAKLEK